MGWPVLGVTGEGGWDLSFCRNKAVKLLKRLNRMSGGGENEADPGMERSRDAVRGFFERGRTGAKGLWPKKG